MYAQMELSHLSACRDALWGLDTHGRVSIRTLSPSCPFGLHWTSLDLNQLGMYLKVTTWNFCVDSVFPCGLKW